MDTKHLFEDGYYFIGNKSVAKCFMFRAESDCKRFKEGMNIHLTPVCEILAFGFLKDEFQLVIKIKSRSIIEEYFLSKNNDTEIATIPETTYIFAQAMANLQSGYAKYFNYKYKRDGGLMKGRYFRSLIVSEAELDQKIEMVNNLKEFKVRNSIWSYVRIDEKKVRNIENRFGEWSSKGLYERGAKEFSDIKAFRNKIDIYVRGHFKKLPPKQLIHQSTQKKLENLVAFMLLKTT